MIILRYWVRNEGQVLASTYPELAEQWNYGRNGALTPWDVTIGCGIITDRDSVLTWKYY